MTEQIAAPPPLPTGVKSKSRWKWWKVLIGVAATLFLVLRLLGSHHSPDLELVRRDLFDAAHDGKVLEITNVGTKPIRLISLTVNDRPDCKVYRLEAILDNATP